MWISSEYLLYMLLIETIQAHLCWFTFRKQKLVQSKKIAVRTVFSDRRALTIYTDFCPVLIVYFNALQINRLLHLSSSLWGISRCCDLLRKIIDQKKCSFITTNKWLVWAVEWSVKYFLLRIHSLNSSFSGKMVEERSRREAITKCFAFQANAINSA